MSIYQIYNILYFSSGLTLKGDAFEKTNLTSALTSKTAFMDFFVPFYNCFWTFWLFWGTFVKFLFTKNQTPNVEPKCVKTKKLRRWWKVLYLIERGSPLKNKNYPLKQ
ncbi:MAG: hypothetical protein LBR36_08910 [Bacteroidales bacterium]|nr:hypothetical protein [Bacteroidales bacterium]